MTNDEIGKKYPYVKTDDLQGGLWIPIDGVADPQPICQSLVKLAKDQGVRMYEHIQVNKVTQFYF